MTRPEHIYMTHVVCVRLSASLSIYLYVYILNKFCSVHPFVLSGSREISTNTSFIDKLKMLRQLHEPSHKIRFSDLVDLWVMKKNYMILCARSTWRLSEQSTKCRSRGKNIPKVCLFYSQNNRTLHFADTFLRNL